MRRLRSLAMSPNFPNKSELSGQTGKEERREKRRRRGEERERERKRIYMCVCVEEYGMKARRKRKVTTANVSVRLLFLFILASIFISPHLVDDTANGGSSLCGLWHFQARLLQQRIAVLWRKER